MLNEKTVRIGLMPPLTGIVEMYGQEISWAARIACDEVNASGGILGKPLELIIEDDGSLPESAVKAAQKLVNDYRCVSLVGNLLSNSRIAVALRVAEASKVPLLNFSFYEGGISSPYFFHFAALPNQQINRMISYMKEKFGPKFFFAGNNYEWPRGSIDAAKRSLRLAGGEIVGEEYYPIGVDINDIDKLLANLKKSGANVFVPYFAGNDQIKLLTRFAEMGLKQQMAVAMGHFDEVMVSRLSPDVRSGFFSSNTYFMTLDTPENKNYLQRLSELPDVTAIWPKGNGLMTNFGEGAYLCVKAFAAAANNAKSLDPDKLRLALGAISITGPQGLVKMDEQTHHAEVSTYLSQCQTDGTFTIIEKFGRIAPIIPERYRFSKIGSKVSLDEDIRLQARIVDQMSELVFLINSIDQTVVYSNPSTAQVFGYSERELIGCKTSMLFSSFGTAETLENDFKVMNDTLYRKGIWQGNVFCTKKNGHDFWCTAAITAFTHGEYGEVWMAVLNDITQYLKIQNENEQNKEALKSLLQEVKQQKEFYGGILDTMKEGFVVHDETGKIIHLNEATEEILGLSRDQIIGKKPIDNWNATREDGQNFPGNEHLGMITATTGEPLHNVVMGVKIKEQLVRWIKINSVPYYTTYQGIKTVALVTFTDISPQIQKKKEIEELQRSLINSNILFNSAQKLAGTGYFNFNTSTGKFAGSDEFYNIFYVNRGAGYSEVMGAIHPEDYLFCTETFQSSVLNKKGYNIEYRLLLADGRVRFIKATGDIAYDPSTFDLLVLGFVQDITELKQAESELQLVKKAAEERREQLVQAHRFEALGRLASGVSHDFNNILSIISGCAELLKLDSVSDSQKIEINSILQAAERASSLTAQLLAYSRRQPLLNEKFNLNIILTEMSQILNRMVGVNIKLEMQLCSFAYINSDRSQIEQIILNLIRNAQEAIPYGGHIYVSTEIVRLPSLVCSPVGVSPGNYVKLCVADNGVGIKADNIPLIFEPFFSTKSLQGGTGLGLSTVYGIVKQYGGHIAIDSKEHEYTIFNIYLPVLSEKEFNMNATVNNEKNNSESELVIAKENRPRILIVEDEVEILRTLIKIFDSKGYDVLSAEDGESALGIYSKSDKKINLIITDYQLPKISGEELISIISQIDSDVKFILISGLAESNFIKLPDAEVRMKVLRKPFRFADILKAAKVILEF